MNSTAVTPTTYTNKNALSFILCVSVGIPESSECGLSLSPVAKRRCIATTAESRSTALFTPPASPKAKTTKPSTGTKKSSKLCMVDGCTSRAKHARKCWRHGGSVQCKVPECNNRAKSKGVCWSHGGGTFCTHPNCGTIAVSHGFCWAHGGGKRCQIDGCSRPAYERTDNFCATHYKQRQRTVPKHF